MSTTPMVQVLSPSATPEEVAAIVAAVETCVAADAAAALARTGGDDTLHEWVRGARLGARGIGLQRGPWRLSGRIARRARA